MTRQDFKEYIKNYAPVILDGATGTNLMAAGMQMGVCPELWVLEHPDVMTKLQNDYIEAGTNILYAPTFTGNRIKLEEYGLQDRLEEINRSLVQLSVKNAGGRALVAGDMTMTGKQLFPLGDLDFEDLVTVYKEQAKVLYEAGVDLFVVETMMSLQECRAAVIAIRETCDLPIMVSLTFNEDGRTLYGTPPEAAVTVLQALGADVIGVNCSTGPAEMIPLVEKMAEYAEIPILAKPNAGLPELEGRETVYRMTPETFAEAGAALVKAGAALVGGCCGTRPDHIRALKEAVRGLTVLKPLPKHRRVLSSERKIEEILLDGNFCVVGERINPTGKKKLQASLRAGSLDLVRDMALEQEKNGARILDINMGMNGINEKEMMKQVIYEVSSTVDCPLCIDTSYVEVMEAALRIYPGRALINSISLEKEKVEKLLPIAKKYGAMFILLPLSDAGLPKSIEEKKQIIGQVCEKALTLGMSHEDIIVDGLVATIGANPNAAKECFETIRYCSKILELPTICGLSNISFGLPERGAVNAAFLTMAIGQGLTMAICNPSQEILTSAAFASDLLLNRPDSDIRYIEHMNQVMEEREEQENKKKEQQRREEEKQQQMQRSFSEISRIAGQFSGMAPASGGQFSGMAPASGGQFSGIAPASGGQFSGMAPASGGQNFFGDGKIDGKSAGRAGASGIAGRLPEKIDASKGKMSLQEETSPAGNGIIFQAAGRGVSPSAAESHPIYQAVVKGSKGSIVNLVKAAVAEGMTPEMVINEFLIPAINRVGDLFNSKKYYLPQLIASANTMKLGIDYLEPLMEKKEGTEDMPVIVIATVEGDIHDIGKNLVALMLKNYGYQVIDMGKDVPCEDIVDRAMKEKAAIIGLSALMTTTMMRMQDIVELAKEKGCTSKIIIGGACITESFAEEIGADGYSRDAAEAVKLVERLLAVD